ncbi:MAG: hypothetical protein EZS28_003534 [Streblomastix strix]|uniref:Uncharacterized protein n=1 Tax=Streblomastix strix TaxID=222440 RepID=A0A5J4X0V4_9EUKA|nr:MAG: hypothetical protein EZS28_003532 [Streblomastix strix]KAA6400939.1 MAG: hypothetical protein EZS28_003534 [Streblomastix strix]
MKELLSWIVKYDEMKRMAALQQDLKEKSSEERADIAEKGVLNEVCEILKRIRDGEDGISGVIDPACFVITLIFEGNPHLIPEALKDNGIVDLLISHIDSSVNECIDNQIESLYIIVKESLYDELHQLFRKGVVKAMSKQLDNDDPKTILKLSEIILLIIQSESNDIKDGQQNDFKVEMERDGTLQKLIETFQRPEAPRDFKDNIALSIAFLFKSQPLPSECISAIIDYLKGLIQRTEKITSCRALTSLAGLAECELNHTQLLDKEFAKEIIQHFKVQKPKLTCLKALQLTISIVKHGQSDTKVAFRTILSITLLRQLSFNQNKEISLAAKELHKLISK